jgi:hypothetical protein
MRFPVVVSIAVLLACGVAWAEDTKGPRAPLLPDPNLRDTQFELDRYHKQVTIIRERQPGAVSAMFVAEPRLLGEGAIMVFQVDSIAPTGVVPRWRCIAQHDVAECLGAPVRFRFLPADQRIVLTATLRPVSELRDALAQR